jgi:hypothetical protein
MSFDRLQQRCDDASEFPMVGSVGALTAEHVELVEQQHPRPDVEEAEDLLEIARRLA